MQTHTHALLFIAMLAIACGDSTIGTDTGPFGDSGGSDTGVVADSGADSAPADTGVGDTGVLDTGVGDSGMMNCVASVDDGDTQATATPKPAVTDCDRTGYSIDADLDGDSDVDWFVIPATDELTCDSAPSVTTGADVRVCVYARCDNMMMTTTTCRDGLPDTSAAGDPGCCTSGGGRTFFDLDCGGILESTDAEITIRIDEGTAMACLPYTLAFNY